MQLVTVCAALAAAAVPGTLANADLFCGCQMRHHRDTTVALHCSREQTGDKAVSCQKAQVPDIPRGYHYLPGYALVKMYRIMLTWEEARKACEAEGAILAVPRDIHAYDGLKQIIITEHKDKGVYWAYLGITDQYSEGVFVGVDGLPVSFLPWRPNEPNNFGGNENCVYVDDKGQLNDWGCANAEPFFCERRLSVDVPASYVWLKDASRFYKVHTEKYVYAEAARVCRSENATLAVPDTWSRVEALVRLFEPKEEFYLIGFTDEAVEGDFVTETGRHLRDMEFQVWKPGEPNNNYLGKPENCLGFGGKGYYDDRSCEVELPFICEIAP